MGQVKLLRGEDVKFVHPDHVEACKAVGWKVEGEKEEAGDTLEALRAKADAMGLKYHPRTGAEKLAELIAAAEAA